MRVIYTTVLLLPILLLGGCDNVPWRENPDDRATDDDAGPVTTYDRQLLFLGTGPDLPIAAAYDFAAVADSETLHRSARIRIASDSGWTPLLDTTWSLAPMREPWRILPHGDLRVVVSDGGEIDALALEGDEPLRLRPGSLLAESSPATGTQLVLRDATLMTADTAYPGVLLDAQVGRATSAPADSAPAAATSIDVLLAHGSDYNVVVVRTAGGLVAWVNEDGEARILRNVTLARDTTAAAGDGAASWRIGAPQELSGTVSSEHPDSTATSATPDYVLVSGWIEDGGVRRDVFGLVRRRR